MAALEDASGIDLKQFRLWYSQAGTPHVTAAGSFDEAARTYTLALKQTVPPTPGQPEKQPMHMPVEMGLLDKEGNDLPLRLQGESETGSGAMVLHLTQAEQEFVFTGIVQEPVPSLFRNFSAPVKLDIERDEATLQFLMRYDFDGFNRVMAARDLATKALKTMLKQTGRGEAPVLSTGFIEAARSVLTAPDLDHAMAAEMLTLPAKSIFSQDYATIDVDGLTEIYKAARLQLSIALHDEWQRIYESLHESGKYAASGPRIARRSLKNLSLHYMAAMQDQFSLAHAERQFRTTDNMTNRLAALAVLVRDGNTLGDTALKEFYRLLPRGSAGNRQMVRFAGFHGNRRPFAYRQGIDAAPGFHLGNAQPRLCADRRICRAGFPLVSRGVGRGLPVPAGSGRNPRR